MHQMKKWPFLLLSLLSLTAFAQNDSVYSLVNCERLFISNNLNLLAAKFNVESAQASVIQARLLENPSLSFEFNAYNPERNKFLDIGSAGDKSFGLEQLIHLGGKKHNEIELARTNATI